MTSYFVRGSTIWLNYYVDGKRVRKSADLPDTPQNRKLVTTKIIPAIDLEIATGRIHKKKPKKFEYYGNIFLKMKDGNRSYYAKQGYWKRVIEHFKGRDIDTITRLEVKQYLHNLDMKSKSKGAFKSCLKGIFELAVDDDIITSNPALSIKLKADEREDIQYYTKEEVQRLLNVATGVMKAYLIIAFNTGMRTGEILGLQLGDFKDDGYIHMQRTRSKGVLGSGKTNNARRKIPYSPELLKAAQEYQPKNSLFIFGDIDDSMHLRYEWDRVVKAAGVKKHKLYASRHTFATIMLQENIVSINELAGLLGHSSAKITLECYASVIKSKNIDLGANFMLFGHNTVTTKKKNV